MECKWTDGELSMPQELADVLTGEPDSDIEEDTDEEDEESDHGDDETSTTTTAAPTTTTAHATTTAAATTAAPTTLPPTTTIPPTTIPSVCVAQPCQNGGACSSGGDSYVCDCTGTGFTGTDCADDIDECTDGTDDCDVSIATCSNTAGSFDCLCDEEGFDGDGTATGSGCEDIDECSEGTDSCDRSKSSCMNLIGSYNCSCDAGYEEAGDGITCNDIDECTEGLDDCLADVGECTNIAGSFSCACMDGYSGDGVNTCTDIDECSDGTDDCHSFLATCTNTVGSFECECNDGMFGDGRICSETLDECLLGLDNCDGNATCYDTNSGFNCICIDGFEGDGTTECTDIDECDLGLDNCHPAYAICNNEAPHFSCDCLPGYSGNGINCIEINECAGQTCSNKGSCTDLVNAFRCDCEYSYWGNTCEYDSKYDTIMGAIDGALYWSFDALNTTGDDKYANQNVNASEFNGDPQLTTMHDYAVSGNSVRTSEASVRDCVNFGDFSGLCVSDPGECADGLSASLWVRLTADEIKESGTYYMLTSGPPDSVGFAIYRSSKKIGAFLGDATFEWRVEVQDMIEPNLWKNIGFSWRADQGLKLLIDSQVVGSSTSGSVSFLAPIIGLLTMGCRHNGGAFTGPSTGLFDELAIWPKWFNSTYEYEWMMGGWDHDDCVIEPCVYGDCYDEGMAAFRCECHAGYIGALCQREIDECASNPCQNGGTCTSHIALYSCECPFGYTGHSCETDMTPNYDVDQVATVSPQTLVARAVHPYYEAATEYWDFSDADSLAIYGSGHSTTVGRGGMGLYPMLGGSDNWIDMGDFAGECLAAPIRCTTGFTLAMWVNFQEDIKNNTEAFATGGASGGGNSSSSGQGDASGIILYSGHYLTGGAVGIEMSYLATEEIMFRVVNGYTNYTEIRLPRELIYYGNWTHYAFIYTPEGDLSALVNGVKVDDYTLHTGDEDHSNFENTLTLGTQFSPDLLSAYSFAISDVVYWNRNLRDFETHVLLGLTKHEFELSTEADYYWSTDGFLRRDQAMVTGGNLPKMQGAGDVELQMAPGRDGKGYAAHVLGDQANLWLLLGDFRGHCISDPAKCSNGLSISVWVQLPQNMDNGTHFILSSGEQVNRGFSIYQRDVDRLGAAVTDGRKRWVAEVTYVPYVKWRDVNLNKTGNGTDSYLDKDALSPWINLALTWSQLDGLTFYIDGHIRAQDPDGYRKFRLVDQETLLVIGRRNDYLGDAINMTFEECAMMERVLKPYELRESLAKLGNLEYTDAKYFWDVDSLFSNTVDILRTKIYDDTAEFIGPSSTVEMLSDHSAVVFTDDAASITLGDFRKNFVSDPSQSRKGMSVGLWVKLTFTSDGTARFILSSGGQVDAGCRGIALYVLDGNLHLKINDGSYTWDAVYNASSIAPGQWTNIAFVWHQTEPLTFYINGAKTIPDTFEVSNMTTSDTYTMFTLGRRNDEESGYYEGLEMHSLVIWDCYLYPKFVHKLMGVSRLEKYFLDQSDFYWSFDPENTLIRSLRSMNEGATYAVDRHHHGRAVYTDGLNDWMSLAKFGDDCVVNPARCEGGFVLAMWIKIKDLYRGELCLVSTGAELSGERGISVQQTPDFLVVTVNDGDYTWSASVSEEHFDYDFWQYLSIRWKADEGLAVGINGTSLASQAGGSRDRRDSTRYRELIIGRCSNVKNTDGYMESWVDDVILRTPTAEEPLPTIESLAGDPVPNGYLSSDEYFNLTAVDSGVTSINTRVTIRGGLQSDARALNTGAYTNAFGYIDMGDFDGRCISSPYQCVDGITFSLWVRIRDTDNFNQTDSNPDGVGYILSSGAQNNESAGFVIYTDQDEVTTFEVHDGVYQWISRYNFTWDGWMNVAMTWTWKQGITAYINGMKQTPFIPDVVTTPIPTTTMMTTLFNSTSNETMVNATDATETTTDVTVPSTTGALNCSDPGNVNDTLCMWNSTTMAPPRPTGIPTRPECNTTRCQDVFTHMFLGRRNDRDDGFLKAEYSDFAVWYTVLNEDDPEFVKKLQGKQFPGIEVTTDHTALDGVSVWTGTIDCDMRHKVDCTTSLNEFYEVAKPEAVIDETLKEEIVVRLKNYSDTTAYITAVEMEMMTELVDKVVARELPEVVNVTEAETELTDVLQITSNLFAGERKRRWISIQQNEGGATKMMNDLDGYAMQLANKMQPDDNGTKGALDTTVTTDNILLSVSRFDIDYDDTTPRKGLTFPNYEDEKVKTINESWQQPEDKITLPSNFFDFTSKDSQSATVIGFMYDTVDEFLPLDANDKKIKRKTDIKLGSRVLSLEVEPKLRRALHNPIVIVLKHKTPKKDGEEALCSFWDYKAKGTINGAWNTDGCDIYSSNATHTICHCYHLTHFGVIIQPMDEVEPDIHAVYIQFVTFGGTALSIIALIILICVYACVKALRTTRNVIHINLCVAMLFAKIGYIMIFMAKDHPIGCKAVAVGMQFFYTAAFAWMLVEGLYLLIEMESLVGMYFRRYRRYLVLIGWGIPCMVTGISVALNFESYGTEDSCWVTFEDGTVYLFVGPGLVIVVINCLIMLYVMRHIDDIAARDKDHFRARKASVRATAILLPLLGITWACAMLNSIFTSIVFLRYLFAALNSLQGVFVFFFHGLGSQEIRMAMKKEDLEVEFAKVEKIKIKQERIKQGKEPAAPALPSYVA